VDVQCKTAVQAAAAVIALVAAHSLAVDEKINYEMKQGHLLHHLCLFLNL